VVAFIIPIIIFIIYRRIKAQRMRKLLRDGERFDKEGWRFEIVEEGKQQ
jgi:hypothetical protein